MEQNDLGSPVNDLGNNSSSVNLPIPPAQTNQPPATQPTAIPNAPAVSPRNSHFSLWVTIAFFLLLVAISGTVSTTYFKNFSLFPGKEKPVSENSASKEVTAQSTKTPYEELSAALEKTVGAKTLYLSYKMAVTSRVSSAATGVTQTLHNNVDGSITGSTDGKTGKMDVKIYNEATPDKSIDMSTINVENGDWYLKTAVTNGKWSKLTKAEFDKLNEDQPGDASLYGLNILGTVLSENKALFKSFKKESVIRLGEEVIDGVTYKKYRVEISTPDFIASLSQDPDRTPRDIKDANEILKDTVMTTEYFVDPNSSYIKRLVVDAKSLTQITTPQSQQLKVNTAHDIVLTADLSRFDVPTNVIPPDPKDVIVTPS